MVGLRPFRPVDDMNLDHSAATLFENHAGGGHSIIPLAARRTQGAVYRFGRFPCGTRPEQPDFSGASFKRRESFPVLARIGGEQEAVSFFFAPERKSPTLFGSVRPSLDDMKPRPAIAPQTAADSGGMNRRIRLIAPGFQERPSGFAYLSRSYRHPGRPGSQQR